jgi:hypothetical protein
MKLQKITTSQQTSGKKHDKIKASMAVLSMGRWWLASGCVPVLRARVVR